ncbi:MAG: TolC family protein [Pseudomonadota bacterium]|nr:TolC family protein [Pseudomonadota bacterium]
MSRIMPKIISIFFFLGIYLLGSGLTIDQVSARELALDLKAVIRIAQENNPQIDIARQQRYQKQGLLTQAVSGYLPHLSTEAGIGQQYIDNLQPDDEDTIGHASLKASQLIYDFGHTGGAIAAGRNSLEAARDNLIQTRKDVVFASKEKFYSVLAKKRLIEVEKEAVANYKQQLYRARKYYDAGIRTKIDVTNAGVNLANARLALLRARSNLKTARARLEQVLGLKPNRGLYRLINNEGALSELAANKPPLSDSVELLLDTAFSSRSDMKAVNSLTKAAKAEIRRARSGYFPSIQAQASYDEYNTDLASAADQWYFGVNLTWEIFSGFQTRGETVTARARFNEITASLKELELAITQEVTDSWLKGIEYRDSVDIADETMQLAAENFVLADKRYKAGLNDMIEYNDAQLSLTRSQSNLVTSYYDYLTALARIENAVGVIPGLVIKETK